MKLEWFDFQEMYDAVVKFNVMAKGIKPIYSPTSDEFYSRMAVQLKLLRDEVDETLEAIEDKDNPEILKEAVDVGVVWMGMMAILRAAGFQIQQGMEDVCDNNLSKIVDNLEDAEKSVAALDEQGVKAYIEEVFYFGETYYAIRRASDGKILKPYFFKKADVSEYVPKVH